MLLISCRLQELGVVYCEKMSEKLLLECIGSLHELTSSLLYFCLKLIAQALSKFLRLPSMTSTVFLDITSLKRDDELLKGIATRCNKLTC